MKSELKNLPPTLFSDVTEEEWHRVCQTSFLTPRLKAKLCRMLDIQNPPPGPIEVLVHVDDVKRIVEELKKNDRSR